MENQITKTIIIYRINVGLLPKEKAEDRMRRAIETFKDTIKLPNYVKMICLPDIHDSSFEVIHLDQNTLNIEELEALIGSEKEQLINVRVSKVEKSILLQKSKKYGFKNLSEYLRFVGLNSKTKVDIKNNI